MDIWKYASVNLASVAIAYATALYIFTMSPLKTLKINKQMKNYLHIRDPWSIS